MSISFNIHANSIDIMMEELTKEPYKSDSDKFIEYVINNKLIGVNDSDGHTPLFVAAINNQLKTLDYLIENGSNINHVDKSGFNILFFAHLYKIETAKYLVRNGIDLNAVSIVGHTPLTTCAISKNTKFCLWLLEQSNLKNINSMTKKGSTALYFASATGNLSLVKFLHKRGANLNLGKDNLKPLNGAMRGKHSEVYKYLLSQGAER